MRNLDKFFVTGLGKSGTTWLQMLLNSHPEIVCLGEGQLFDDIPRQLQKLLQDHNQTQDYLRHNNFNSPHIPLYPRFDGKDQIAILRFVVERVFEKFPTTEETKAVGDKSPTNAISLELIDITFPDAKIVHIIRDPRDVLISTWHHFKRAKPQQLKEIFGDDIELLAKEILTQWHYFNTKAFDFRAKKPGKVAITTYETLTTQSEKELEKLFHFLEVSCDKELVLRCIEQNQFEKLSGGRKKGEANNSAFFRKGKAGAWSEELDPSILNHMPPQGKELMKHLGYQLEAT